ncbi:MAG: hemolysin family protein [Pseudomonadota bacterium]
MTVTIIAVVLLLAANAFFVAAEFALVKVRGLRIEALADEGGPKARLSLKILRNIEAYLAACQLGITMASLGLGWVGEPAVAALLRPLLEPLNLDPTLLHTIAFVIGFLVFSSLHIVIGEQVPKTYAIRRPEPVALWVAYPLHGFFIFCYPLNWALNRASRACLNLMGIEEASHIEVYSGEELRGLIGASHQYGSMQKHEHDMLGGILDLVDHEVREIMTHRKDVVTVDADMPLSEVTERIHGFPYTRYPLWRGDPDTIIGVLHAKDAFSAAHDEPGDEAIDLAELAVPPWFIPDTTSLRHQLLAFRQRREHLAIVVDEYGAIMGIVTLEDILEEIVGEIADEKDIEVPGVRLQGDGSVIVEGRVTVRDLNRQFHWHLPDEEASTIAGLVINHIERIPRVGQSFLMQGLRIEILRRQKHQVTLMRLRAFEAPRFDEARLDGTRLDKPEPAAAVASPAREQDA